MIRGPEAWGATLLRVMLGVIFVMHGYYGYAVLSPAATAGLITRLGYPAALSTVLAWYLILAHVVGGVLLIVGLWTRLAALLQVPIMASAVFLLHLSQGFFMRLITVETPGGPRSIVGGYEFSLLVLAATLALALLGPGALSVDGARGKGRWSLP